MCDGEPEWRVDICCPFCNDLTVSAIDCDIVYQDDDLSDDEKMDLSQESDDILIPCKHVAFFSDWAYMGSEIQAKWEEQMTRLARHIDPDATDPAETIAGHLILDPDPTRDLMSKVLSEYNAHIEHVYVEKYDGPQRGGPTYMIIYIDD